MNLLFRIAAGFDNAWGRFVVSSNFVPQLIDAKPYQFAHAVPTGVAVNLTRKDGGLDNLASPAIKERMSVMGLDVSLVRRIGFEPV